MIPNREPRSCTTLLFTLLQVLHHGTALRPRLRCRWLHVITHPLVTLAPTLPPLPPPCSSLFSSNTPRCCSYERASIEAWFASGKTTSPKTGAQLTCERMRGVTALHQQHLRHSCVNGACSSHAHPKSRPARARAGVAGAEEWAGRGAAVDAACCWLEHGYMCGASRRKRCDGSSSSNSNMA